MLLWLRNLNFRGGIQSVFPPGVVKFLFSVPAGDVSLVVPAGHVTLLVPAGDVTETSMQVV